MLTESEKKLLSKLRETDNIENYFDNAETSNLIVSKETGLGVIRQRGYPDYKSQIDLNVQVLYGLTSLGTLITPSSLPAAAKTPIPIYLFGNSDSQGAYAVAKSYDPINSYWSLIGQQIVGSTVGVMGSCYNAILPFTKTGDLVMGYYSSTGGVECYVIVSCANVAYGTLLASLNSDKFVICGIRMNVYADIHTSQFSNNLRVITQTLFGKSTNDTLSPNSYVDPQNQIKYIVDVPLVKGIDKNVVFTYFNNFDLQKTTLSLFIKDVVKIQS